MGRAALGWGIRELANKASVDKATISRFENGSDAYASTIEKIHSALEAPGEISFSGDNCVYVVTE